MWSLNCKYLYLIKDNKHEAQKIKRKVQIVSKSKDVARFRQQEKEEPLHHGNISA